jgi:4-hydroxybenzoate polyprenyltransferase
MRASALVGLVRPFTLLAPAVGAASGALVARSATGTPWRADVVTCGVASALFATAASNAWNQVFDLDIDRTNKPGRPLPSGRMTPRAALVFGHLFAATSLVLAAFATPAFLACVAVGVLATWLYSAPPLRTKRMPVGALVTIAVPRGLLVPVAGWALVAPPTVGEPWVLGAVVGLFVFGAAATKDFADVQGDRAHGCRTLPVLFGARRAARLVAPFLVVPFLVYPLAGWRGWLQPPLPALLLLAGALLLLGAFTAWALLRDPEGLAARGRNHPAWAGMYLLMLAAHVGTALTYALSLPRA